MTQRLAAAFATLAERGATAGAHAVWQRAVLAAAVDDRHQLSPGDATPLVPVVQPGGSDWVDVRPGDPFAGRRGRGRIGLAVGLSAAALLGAGLSAIVLRGGGDGGPGAPGDPGATTMVPATTAFVEATSVPDAGTDTTAAMSATTFGGSGDIVEPAGFGFAIGQPCVFEDAESSVPSTVPPNSAVVGTAENTATTAVGSFSGYDGPVCAYPQGTLPPVADGPGGDWVSAPTTLPADAALAYWRMLDDLDITWREEPDGTHLYWRTPAGQSGATDGIGGAAVLLIPAADRYIVLARAGTTDSGAPGQRPIQVRATLADGSVAVAPITYDNSIGLGHAYLDTTQTVVEVAAI